MLPLKRVGGGGKEGGKEGEEDKSEHVKEENSKRKGTWQGGGREREDGRSHSLLLP